MTRQHTPKPTFTELGEQLELAMKVKSLLRLPPYPECLALLCQCPHLSQRLSPVHKPRQAFLFACRLMQASLRVQKRKECGYTGTVVTLLSTEQVHHYKAMLRKIDNTFVKDLPLQAGAISALRPKVKQAIENAAGQVD